MKYYYITPQSVEIGPYLAFEFRTLVQKGNVREYTLIRREHEKGYSPYSSLEAEIIEAQKSLGETFSPESKYYYDRQNFVYGPFTLLDMQKALRDDVIDEETPIRSEESGEWALLYMTSIYRLLIGEPIIPHAEKKRRLKLRPKNGEIVAK